MSERVYGAYLPPNDGRVWSGQFREEVSPYCPTCGHAKPGTRAAEVEELLEEIRSHRI